MSDASRRTVLAVLGRRIEDLSRQIDVLRLRGGGVSRRTKDELIVLVQKELADVFAARDEIEG